MGNFMVVQRIPRGYGKKDIDLFQREACLEKCGRIRQNLYLNYLDQDIIGDDLVSNISEKWMEHDPKNRVR
jgi:hypothetical protein